MHHPVITLRPRQCFISSLLKVCGIPKRIRSVPLKGELWSPKHLYWVIFPSSSFSIIFQRPLWFSGQTWGSSCSVLLHIPTASSAGLYPGPNGGRTVRGIRSNRGLTHPLGTILLPGKTMPCP